MFQFNITLFFLSMLLCLGNSRPIGSDCPNFDCPPIPLDAGAIVCETTEHSPETNDVYAVATALEDNPVFAPYLGAQETRRRVYQKNGTNDARAVTLVQKSGTATIAIQGDVGVSVLSEDVIRVARDIAAECSQFGRAGGRWISGFDNSTTQVVVF